MIRYTSIIDVHVGNYLISVELMFSWFKWSTIFAMHQSAKRTDEATMEEQQEGKKRILYSVCVCDLQNAWIIAVKYCWFWFVCLFVIIIFFFWFNAIDIVSCLVPFSLSLSFSSRPRFVIIAPKRPETGTISRVCVDDSMVVPIHYYFDPFGIFIVFSVCDGARRFITLTNNVSFSLSLTFVLHPTINI